MKNLKISHPLLSDILSCKCEFRNAWKNKVRFYANQNDQKIKDLLFDEIIETNDWVTFEINLDAFIRLGKIWAFENGYDIIERGLICLVTEAVEKKEKYSVNESRDEKISFWAKDYDIFLYESIINCLEWVQKEVNND